jgi:hypothetical protein
VKAAPPFDCAVCSRRIGKTATHYVITTASFDWAVCSRCLTRAAHADCTGQGGHAPKLWFIPEEVSRDMSEEFPTPGARVAEGGVTVSRALRRDTCNTPNGELTPDDGLSFGGWPSGTSGEAENR